MEKNGEKKNVVSRSALLHAQNKKKKKEKGRACVYSNAESNRGPFANSIISLRFEREKANDFNCVKRT